MATCEFKACQEAGCKAEFNIRLDPSAPDGADDVVRCVHHGPADPAGWTFVVYDDGQFVDGPEGPLGKQVWQSGARRQLWFRTDGRVLGPNLRDAAIIEKRAFAPWMGVAAWLQALKLACWPLAPYDDLKGGLEELFGARGNFGKAEFLERFLALLPGLAGNPRAVEAVGVITSHLPSLVAEIRGWSRFAEEKSIASRFGGEHGTEPLKLFEEWLRYCAGQEQFFHLAEIGRRSEVFLPVGRDEVTNFIKRVAVIMFLEVLEPGMLTARPNLAKDNLVKKTTEYIASLENAEASLQETQL